MTAAGGAMSRRKGQTAEQALARYLRQWWPNAKRAVSTGWSTHAVDMADPGDISGVPGVIVSCKAVKRPEWSRWWPELDAMLAADPAALGVIVEKRAGQADPAAWWAHLRLGDLVGLAAEDDGGRGASRAPVRLRVDDLVALLVAQGYARGRAS